MVWEPFVYQLLPPLFVGVQPAAGLAVLAGQGEIPTGYAVVDYINMFRIQRAKDLLKDPRNRIYWIETG